MAVPVLTGGMNSGDRRVVASSDALSQAEHDYRQKRDATAAYPAWLHILHASPYGRDAGGVGIHVLDLIATAQTPRALMAYRNGDAIVAAEILNGDTRNPLLHRFEAADAAEFEGAMRRLIECLTVNLVHIHQLSNWPIRAWRVVDAAGLPFFFTVHDFHCVCPNYHLFNYARLGPCLCDLSPATTRECLGAWRPSAKLRSPFKGTEPVRQHREEFRALLSAARGVLCPSENARQRVERTYPHLRNRLTVIPHGVDRQLPPSDGTSEHASRLRVGVLGNVSEPLKGAEHYVELVGRTRSDPIEWHFFGELNTPSFVKRLGGQSHCRVVIHGSYRRETVAALLVANEIDVVAAMPGVHETFSFTASEALCAGIPVLALRMGALEEKLSGAGLAECLIGSSAEAANILAQWARHRERLQLLRDRLRKFRHRSVVEMVDETLAVYGEEGATIRRRGAAPDGASWLSAFEAYRAAEAADDSDRPALLHVDPAFGPLWYRLARALEDVTPTAIQAPLRRLFITQRWKILAEYRFSEMESIALEGPIEFVGRRLGAAVFRSNGPYGSLILPVPGMEICESRYLRLRIRCAQRRMNRKNRGALYWTYESGQGLSTVKKWIIPLELTTGWQDVMLDLRHRDNGAGGLPSSRLTSLRLVPHEGEGDFELDTLWFLRPRLAT